MGKCRQYILAMGMTQLLTTQTKKTGNFVSKLNPNPVCHRYYRTGISFDFAGSNERTKKF